MHFSSICWAMPTSGLRTAGTGATTALPTTALPGPPATAGRARFAADPTTAYRSACAPPNATSILQRRAAPSSDFAWRDQFRHDGVTAMASWLNGARHPEPDCVEL